MPYTVNLKKKRFTREYGCRFSPREHKQILLQNLFNNTYLENLENEFMNMLFCFKKTKGTQSFIEVTTKKLRPIPYNLKFSIYTKVYN